MNKEEQEREVFDITDWQYIGDVNLEYGGTYFRFDEDYAEACRVIDLDSATGAQGLTLIERIVVYGLYNKSNIEKALSCIGLSIKDLRGKGKTAILFTLVDAFIGYGYYDPDDSWANYRRPSNWVVVNSDYGALSDKQGWNIWKPDREQTVILHHKYGGDLESYIEQEILF